MVEKLVLGPGVTDLPTSAWLGDGWAFGCRVGERKKKYGMIASSAQDEVLLLSFLNQRRKTVIWEGMANERESVFFSPENGNSIIVQPSS